MSSKMCLDKGGGEWYPVHLKPWSKLQPPGEPYLKDDIRKCWADLLI